MIPTIKTVRVAHNIGFSSALNEESNDGYVEASRWRFVNRKVHRGFLKGWSYGYELRKEVLREKFVSKRLLQASDFSGDGTVEIENIMGACIVREFKKNKIVREKLILDPCCGSRMMWYNKQNPLVAFGDIRRESHTLCDGRALEVDPDFLLDARCLPFADESFYHVVQDWPHMKKLGKNSWMAKKYGVLLPTWETDVKGMFDEGMRVLRPCGTMVIKWNESQITETELTNILGVEPMYGHRSGKGNKTIWMNFFKEPQEPQQEK